MSSQDEVQDAFNELRIAYLMLEGMVETMDKLAGLAVIRTDKAERVAHYLSKAAQILRKEDHLGDLPHSLDTLLGPLLPTKPTP